jgi:hypothetical protein
VTDEQKFLCLDGSHPRNAITSMKVWPFPFTEHDPEWCWCEERRHNLPEPPTMRVTSVEFEPGGVPWCILHGTVGRKAAMQVVVVEQGLEVAGQLRDGERARIRMGRYGSWVHP